MKKIYFILIVLFPLLIHAEVIVTRYHGNIENVSDVDTTEYNTIYYIQDYQTKSIDRNSVLAIIYDDGQTLTLSHAEDENQDDLKNVHVGELLTFPDGSQGIVFFTSGDGHGLVVSLKETNAKWDIRRKREMQDIVEIPNTETAMAAINQIGEGSFNTGAILKHMSSFLCPAATWCVEYGEEWYLPTAHELLYLFVVANHRKGENGPISREIVKNGGIELNGDWYWTSSESERTEAINITTAGRCATEEKSESNAVRAIRAF